MDAKLDKISELSNILCEKESLGQKIVAVSHDFELGKLMRQAHITKDQGVPCSALLLYLLLIRLLEISIFCFYKAKWFGLLSAEIGKNCFYRFLSNPSYNWRSLLLGIAKQFLRIVERRGGTCDDTPFFYIVDDTTLEKTGSHFEGMSRVFDHTDGRHKSGYKLLTLSFFDGKSSIPLDCSLHAEKGRKGDYSLSAKERKGLFRKKRDADSPGYKRRGELDEEKPQVVIRMIRRAWKRCIRASYFLADSWFDGIDFIKGIREVADGAVHVICMTKNGNRRYEDGKYRHTGKELVAMNERKAMTCRKYKCRYFRKDVVFEGMELRLFFVQYGKSTTWNILLTTDKGLSFTKVFEYYQIRWNQEVMYRESKQYLGLGKCQSTDFDVQIADCTLALATYTILTLYRRFGEYETMGELFRQMQADLMALTLWQRILPIIAQILYRLCHLLGADFEQAMRTLQAGGNESEEIILIISTPLALAKLE